VSFVTRFPGEKWVAAGSPAIWRRCKEYQEKKTLFFDLSGHGHFDMAACDKYFSRELADYIDPEEALKASLANLPKVAAQLLQ